MSNSPEFIPNKYPKSILPLTALEHLSLAVGLYQHVLGPRCTDVASVLPKASSKGLASLPSAPSYSPGTQESVEVTVKVRKNTENQYVSKYPACSLLSSKKGGFLVSWKVSPVLHSQQNTKYMWRPRSSCSCPGLALTLCRV